MANSIIPSLIDILDVRDNFKYTVWPVFEPQLKSVRYRVVGEDHNNNGFIRDDNNIIKTTPLQISISDTADSAFFVKASELGVHESDGKILVFWHWSIVSSYDPVSENTTGSISPDLFDDDDDETCSCASEEWDCVSFKVIGNLKEDDYQKTLKEVAEKLHANEDVRVELCREPDNPFDKKAIAFVCYLNESKHRIGYVVRECLEEVHYALANDLVKSTKFAWCKYRAFNGRLGYYAAVNITRFGKWPNEIHQRRSHD